VRGVLNVGLISTLVRLPRNPPTPCVVCHCMFNRTIILALAGHACLLTSAAIAQTIISPGPSLVSFTRSYFFLPVGLAPSETAQINVVNTAPPPVAGTSSTPLPPCAGTISFLNASGAVIGKATPFIVAPGQIVSATLPYGSAGVAGAARAEIRGEVQIIPTPTPAAVTGIPIAFPACSLSYSFETFDTATGVTHAFNGGAGASFQPIPLQVLGH
jgi:hypothetical protein